jgi:oligosaccharide reducing-end xylanase
MSCVSSANPQTSTAGTPGGAFSTGAYLYLFVEVGHLPQEVTNRVHAAFRQLSHGDPQSDAVYFPNGTNANGPLAFIYDVNSRDVRSEAMSYGMLYLLAMLHCSGEFRIWLPH